jgi:hypothetical protein
MGRSKLRQSVQQTEGSRVSLWSQQLTEEWDDELEGFAQLCQLCVSTVTDIFIYYAQSASSMQ